MKAIKELFNKPKIIGIAANINQGKSNLIYYLIKTLQEENKFNLYVYGLKNNVDGAIKINSVAELENIKNSVIIIDEMFSLFDLDQTRIKAQLEKSFRLINHNNNILILCGVGENYKKFLSSKLEVVIFKKINFYDLINGSRVKNIALNYKGPEMGSTLLNLNVNEALVFDGQHYFKIEIPYFKEMDTKLKNINIFQKHNITQQQKQKMAQKSRRKE